MSSETNTQANAKNTGKKDKIIIIGMPCSGKTSIGKMIAERYDFSFCDLDDELELNDGRPISRIFAEDGEEGFRKIETETVKKAMDRHNVVISTGGGIVKQHENMSIIKSSDVLVLFIHRTVDKLVATPQRVQGKRPLLKNASIEDIIRIYKERLPLYKRYADLEVFNNDSKEDTFAKICEKLDPVYLNKFEASKDDENSCN